MQVMKSLKRAYFPGCAVWFLALAIAPLSHVHHPIFLRRCELATFGHEFSFG
jgi:hypothetical protein